MNTKISSNGHYVIRKKDYPTKDIKSIKDELITVSKKVSSRKSDILFIDNLVVEEIEDHIKLILYNIINNDFIQNEDISRCEWCEYKLICNR